MIAYALNAMHEKKEEDQQPSPEEASAWRPECASIKISIPQNAFSKCSRRRWFCYCFPQATWVVVAEPKISSLSTLCVLQISTGNSWGGARILFSPKDLWTEPQQYHATKEVGPRQPEDETNNIINTWRAQGPYLITWSRICSSWLIRNIVCFHYSALELPIWIYTSSHKSWSPQWNAWPLADIMLISEQIALLLETGEGGSCVQGSYCGRKLNLHRSTSGGRINIYFLFQFIDRKSN